MRCAFEPGWPALLPACRREEAMVCIRWKRQSVLLLAMLLPACGPVVGDWGLGPACNPVSGAGCVCSSCPPVPACTSVQWIIPPNPLRAEIDLTSTPPQARVRVGDTSGTLFLYPVNPVPENCHHGGQRSREPFTSSDPLVARVERLGTEAQGPSHIVRAVSPGDAILFVDGVPGPSDANRAVLSHCPPGGLNDKCPAPVRLTLRVVP